jgi:quinol monooxygenase YgiN
MRLSLAPRARRGFSPFLHELYDDDAAVAAHLRSPNFLAMDEQTRGWTAHRTVRRLNLSNP